MAKKQQQIVVADYVVTEMPRPQSLSKELIDTAYNELLEDMTYEYASLYVRYLLMQEYVKLCPETLPEMIEGFESIKARVSDLAETLKAFGNVDAILAETEKGNSLKVIDKKRGGKH